MPRLCWSSNIEGGYARGGINHGAWHRAVSQVVFCLATGAGSDNRTGKTYENVGKSQSVLLMTNPIIFTRTRSPAPPHPFLRPPARWGRG
eukprot:COSAG01_NODE_177_length_22954_cov_28.699554_22_plen_90_part_00